MSSRFFTAAAAYLETERPGAETVVDADENIRSVPSRCARVAGVTRALFWPGRSARQRLYGWSLHAPRPETLHDRPDEAMDSPTT